MVKASPAASFVVTQSEFLLQFLIVPLDDPTMFGQMHQFDQRQIGRHGGQPVFCRLGLSDGPFHEQPFLGVRLGPLIIPMCWTHP